MPQFDGNARDRSPERHELVFDLDRSSGSRLGRVLLVEDHYFRGWSRLETLEAIVVLKPLFGPWRRIAVPVVLYRRAQVQFPRIGAPTAMDWLAPSADPGCTAAATLAVKESAGPKPLHSGHKAMSASHLQADIGAAQELCPLWASFLSDPATGVSVSKRRAWQVRRLR